MLNPVRAGLVKRASDWRWSSYAATARAAAPDGPVSTAWLLRQFHADPRAARRLYRSFIAEGGETYRPWDALAGGAVLGGERFRAAVAKRLGGRLPDRSGEVPRRHLHLARPGLDALRAAATERGTWMTAAYRDHGYTMIEIADAAGLHLSSVSKIIKAHQRMPNSRYKT